MNKTLAYALLVIAAATVLNLHAGPQREEHLADSVRTALSAAVAGLPSPEPYLPSAADKKAYDDWLITQQQRLSTRLVQMHGTAGLPELATPALQKLFLQTVWYESHRAALDPSLVLGLIEVESGFRKYAVSSAGAMGVMQVMPFWPRLLGQGEPSILFQWQANLRFGCVILRHYVKLEDGQWGMALGRYNGSRGQSAYPQAVLAAQQRWQP
ncbi:MAG: transglycosylase SLT domain-containing protein [Limnohabitans sp.]